MDNFSLIYLDCTSIQCIQTSVVQEFVDNRVFLSFLKWVYIYILYIEIYVIKSHIKLKKFWIFSITSLNSMSNEVEYRYNQNKRWRKQERHRNSSSLLIYKWYKPLFFKNSSILPSGQSFKAVYHYRVNPRLRLYRNGVITQRQNWPLGLYRHCIYNDNSNMKMSIALILCIYIIILNIKISLHFPENYAVILN